MGTDEHRVANLSKVGNPVYGEPGKAVMILPAGQVMTVMREVGLPLRSCPMIVPVSLVR